MPTTNLINQDRLDRKRRTLRPGTAPYLREQALYEAVVGTFNDQGSAAEDAHAKLCDLNWWRSSASGSAVKELLAVPGADPNHICNFNNERPIHLPLKLTSFALLTLDIMYGIDALVDGGADLRVRNNAGQSAQSLSEVRYDRVADRMIQHTVKWCNDESTDQQLLDEITRNGSETGSYIYIKHSATGRTSDDVQSEVMMDLFLIEGARGTIDYRVLCPYRGVNGPW